MLVTASTVRLVLIVRKTYVTLMSTSRKFRRYSARDRARWLRGLWPLACGDCGFISCWKHGRFLLRMYFVVQVQTTVTSRSLVQRSPAECD